MLLEFKICKITEDSVLYTLLIEKYNQPNEFIIVGEEENAGVEFYQLQHVSVDGIKLLSGIKINKAAYLAEKKEVILPSKNDFISTELDIPKEYLTMDIIENIQRLNELS